LAFTGEGSVFTGECQNHRSLIDNYVRLCSHVEALFTRSVLFFRFGEYNTRFNLHWLFIITKRRAGALYCTADRVRGLAFTGEHQNSRVGIYRDGG
jgi:hypothetical protein